MDSETGILLGQIKGKLDTMHEDAGKSFGNLFERMGDVESNTKVLRNDTDKQEVRLKKVEHTIAKAVTIAAAIVGAGVGLPKLLEMFLP